MLPGYYLKYELGKKSKILLTCRPCGSIHGSVTWKNRRSPAVFSLSLLTSPRCLPHFPSLSSVRQLSYWHSHHLLRTRWISLLQKSFCTVPQPRPSHLPGCFPFSAFSSLPHLLPPPISTSPPSINLSVGVFHSSVLYSSQWNVVIMISFSSSCSWLTEYWLFSLCVACANS